MAAEEITQIAGFVRDPLKALVGYALRRIQVDLMSQLAAELLPLGLRPVTFSVLAVIEASQFPSQSDIGGVLGIQRANFVAIAAELEQAGLIFRAQSAIDRRQYVVSLTREGAERLRRAWRVVQAQEARIEERLGEDKQHFLTLLARLTPPQPTAEPEATRAEGAL